MKFYQTLKIGLCSLLLLTIGGMGLAHATNTNAGSEITLTTDATDPLQVLFLVGINELEKGNYVGAVDIFNALAQKTESPRVKLELARALFLDRRYRASEKVFQDVLKQPDIPWPVQENIRAYLEEIDSALGFVRFGISLVSDSNPRNFTDSRQIRILGQLLTVMPPEDNEAVSGVRFSVNSAKALTDDGAIIGYLNGYFSHFEKTQFDRGVGDIGLFFSSKTLPKFKLRTGIEESMYGGRHHYEFPYVGLIFTPQPSDQFFMNSELKMGWLRVPEADHLDAKNLSLTTKMNRQLLEGILATGDLYLEKSMADEDAYSYHGGSLGLSLNLPFLKYWSLKPYASVGKRIYEDVDPFFADTRRDTITKFGITLKNWNIKVFGQIPEIGISFEKNSSSLDFYSYDKILFILSVN